MVVYKRSFKVLLAFLIVCAWFPSVTQAAVLTSSLVQSGSGGQTPSAAPTNALVGGGLVSISVPITVSKYSNPGVPADIFLRVKAYGLRKDGTGYAQSSNNWTGYVGPFHAEQFNGYNYTVVINDINASDLETVTKIIFQKQARGDTYIDYTIRAGGTATVTDNDPPTAPIISTSSGTWAQSQVVTVGGSTDNADVSGYMVNVDNGGWTSYSSPFGVWGTGAHSVQAYAYDTSNLQSPVTSITVYVDNTPPTTPTINASSGWMNVAYSDVFITPGDDNNSGVNRTEYYLSGAQSTGWQTGTGVRIVNEGLTTVHARTIDNAGNVSSETQTNVYIDRTAPDASITKTVVNAGVSRLTLNALDGGSGIKSITLPNGNVVNGSNASYDIISNGTYIFTVRDNVGLVTTRSITVTDMDTTPPIISVTNPVTAWVQALDLHVEASDAHSGLDYILLPNSSKVTQGVTNYKVTENGTYMFKAFDKAGNVASQSIAVTNVDTEKPTITLDYPTIPLQSVTFTFNASDNASGIAKVTLPDGTEDVQSGIKDYKGTYTVNENGTYTFKVEDVAGNIQFKTVTIVNIDTFAPEIKVVNPAGWHQEVSLNVTASDADSGVDYITLPDGKELHETSTTYIVKENGTYSFRVTDKAGNFITYSLDVANVDTTPPGLKVTPSGRIWGSTEPTLTINYSDSDSGLDQNKLYYKVTSSTDKPSTWDLSESFEQKVTINQEGEWYVHVKATDNVGNESYYVTDKYQYQKNPELVPFTVTGLTANQIRIDWGLTPSMALTDGWQFVIRNKNTNQTYTVDYPQTSITDTGLNGGTRYAYTFEIRNHVGSTGESTSQQAYTLPDKPTLITVDKSGQDYSTVLVSYPAILSADEYHLKAYNNSTGVVDGDTTVTGNTYQPLTGLHPYVPYTIIVSGINASGEGVGSSTSFLSLPDAPNGFSAVQMFENSIHLTWNTVSRATYDWSTVQTDTYYKVESDNTRLYEGLDNFYNHEGLDSGTEHSYQVASSNATGYGNYSYLSNIWTLPSAVKGFEQVGATTDSVNMKWIEPRGVTGYNLRIEGFPDIVLSKGTTTYTMNGLQSGVTYKAIITPKNSSGFGSATELMVVVKPQDMLDSNVTVTDMQETSAIFNITPVPGATKYLIHVNDQDYTVSSGATTINGLSGALNYSYTVSAGNEGGYSEPARGTFLTRPAMPMDFKVQSLSSSEVTFTWAKPQNVVSFNIYGMDQAPAVSVTSAVYTASGIPAGGWVTLYVSGVNASGEGAKSKVTYRMLPASVTGEASKVQVSNITTTSVDLDWLEVPGADGYNVLDTDGNVVSNVLGTHYKVEGLNPATTYKGWTVIPYNSAGNGGDLIISTFITAPTGLVTVTDGGTTTSTATLNISGIPDNEIVVISLKGQEVYRGTADHYVQSNLSAGTDYTFVIWTENANGLKSATQDITVRTRTVKEDTTTVNVGNSVSNTPDGTSETPTVQTPNGDNNTPDIGVGDNTFTDTNGIWGKSAIDDLRVMGLIEGVSANQFDPDRDITRSEFMAMVDRAKRYSISRDLDTTFDLSFGDTPNNAWYTPELKDAMQHQYVKGYSDKVFAPDDLVNREQAAKMVVNAYLGQVDDEVDSSTIPFTDAQNIVSWASGSVKEGTDLGLIEGYPNHTFKPKNNLTRQEAAVLIHRLVKIQS